MTYSKTIIMPAFNNSSLIFNMKHSGYQILNSKSEQTLFIYSKQRRLF